MKRLVNSYYRLLVLLLLVSLAVIGCRKPGSDSSSGDTTYDPSKDSLVNPESLFESPPEDLAGIATEETLFIQLDGSPNTLHPFFVSSMYDFTVVDTLYTGLFTFGKDMKWKVNDDLVVSFEESQDHTEFVVKIKPGFTWHDGVPWTAHDVVYSWGQILDPRVPTLTQKPTTEPIKECIALDDYTVKFVQPEAFATRLWNLTFPIIPRHIFEKDKEKHPDLKGGDYYNQQARSPVGSGPYKLVEWKENDKIIIERWEEYAGEKPYFKRIVFRIIPDRNMSLLSFEKGEVDVIGQLTQQQFAYETNDESFRRQGYKVWGNQWDFVYIGWNMDGSNPYFHDRHVRYAMTHALNLPRIFDKVFCNLALPCSGIYHPEAWMYNPQVKPLQYDLKKSAVLLDKAGWLADPQDGWRYKQIKGEKVKFQFTLLISQGSQTAPKIAAIFQQDLKRIGIEMKTRTLEWATFLEKIRNHEFQAETAAWGTGTDPDTGWNIWRTEEYKNGRNYGGYSNSRVDELFELGRKEYDFEARRKIYQEIHKLIYDDQPYTWIYNRPTLAAINKRIRGVQLSPRGIYNFDPSFNKWWVPQGRTKNADVSMP